MKQLFKDLPVYKISNFCKSETDKFFDENYDKFIKEYNENLKLRESGDIPRSASSFPVKNNEYTKILISKLYNFAKKKFKFTKSPYYKDYLCSYISNKDFSESNIHNHYDENCGKIVLVYYFNTPKDFGGRIEFKISVDDSKIYYYKPKKYDLLILPDALLHRPEKIFESEEYRISLNFDIATVEESYYLFAPFFKKIKLPKRPWWKFWVPKIPKIEVSNQF